ncbi:hypothetical protein DRQ50_09360 [bacterium]|nr:MAG: hypothetical protein DRQ50_09360 [bacterium]
MAENWGENQWSSVGTYDVKVQARCHDHIDILSEWSAATTVTVTEAPAETIGTPEIYGTTTGTTIEALAFSCSVVTSSLGHTVMYVFSWGDGTANSSTYSPNSGHLWNTPGTYDVRVMAHCAEHPEYESDWSPAIQVTITEADETISSPPQMVSSVADFAAVDEEVWVSCYGVVNNLGHVLEYRFDLGDGTISDWTTTRTVYYAWSTAGTYTILAQARCVDHPEVITDWTRDTYVHEITIYDGLETLLPAELEVTIYEIKAFEQHTYVVRSGSSMGHRFEARIDWGNGEVSDWVGSGYGGNNIAYINYTYQTSGTFEVMCQARCIEHPDIITEWSSTTSVPVSETITRPTITGDVTGTVGVPATWLAADAVSSDGHALEYALLVGNTEYDWTSSPTQQHTFDAAGTYYVRIRARCAEHPDITSGYTDSVRVVITD